MKAILVYPETCWPVGNRVYEEYNYTVVIFSDKDTNQESPEFVDTYTK